MSRTYCILFSLQMDCISVNSADLDRMPHYAAFHLGPHCLLMYAPKEHSAMLLTFIKLPFVVKTFVLSIFE